MIDFHSHILPGIDDGSETFEQTVKMLEAEKAQGVSAVVATPHFYADSDLPERFLKRRNQAFESLLKNADISDLPPIILGAEVSYFEGMSDCEELKDLCISGTDMILVEMPAISWNDRMISEISAIYEKTGLIPVIAHIDRYIKVFGKKNMADWFEGLPVLIQANSNFLEERKFAKLAYKMFLQSKIHLFGSDCHNLTSRPANMNIAFDAIRNKFGDGAIAKIEATEKAFFEGSKKETLQIAYS